MVKHPHPQRWLVVFAAFLFTLVLLPGITWAQASQGPQIRLQYATFDPLEGEPPPALPQSASALPEKPGVYLLQFTGPVQAGWKAAIEDLGIRLYGYIPDYAFIARMDGAMKVQADRLPFVRWTGPYRPEYRLAPGLLDLQKGQVGTTPVSVVVETLPEEDLDRLASRAQSLGARVEERQRGDLTGTLRASLPADRLGELAALQGVAWVEPYFEPELFNDVAGGTIMQAGSVRSSLGLYGGGQIVAVADSGLDRGAAGVSADFAGRVQAGQPICASFTGGRTTWNDFNGHGTHVAGSVLGNGALSGSNPGAHQYGGSFAGVAPEAHIIVQALDNSAGGGLECVPFDLFNYVFKPAYDQGARIHTNSWGGPTGGTSPAYEYGGYTSSSRAVDQAAWSYKNLLVLFAAGNSGVDGNRDGFVDPDSLAAPGTAKNALTVGASENYRPVINYSYGYGWPDDYPSNPIYSDLVSNNSNGMAAFSSRGPADDGRIKPDLVAPGTFILSTRSHDPGAAGYVGWGGYNQDYLYNGGTSMATPLVAGAAALVREWLTDLHGFTNPSAALVKAVLVNGADDMSPGQYASPQEVPVSRPNNVSGWGRVDLAGSLKPPAPLRVWLNDVTPGLQTGEQVQFTLTTGLGQSTHQAAGTTNSLGASLAIDPIQVTPQPPTSGLSENANPLRQAVTSKLDSPPGASLSDGPAASQATIVLALDDGGLESVQGVGDSNSQHAYQFIWFNRFTPPPSAFPFTLDEIRVMFYDDAQGTWNVDTGDAVDLLVYQDPDGNPANGANLLATFHETVKAVDGSTWSVYTLPSPVVVNGPGDVLVGVINRYVVDGVTPMSYPATIDTTANQGRSWWGLWAGAPPDPAVFPPNDSVQTIPGNWLVRASGHTGASPSPTPTATATPPPTYGGPLRLTLAWTDYPASLSASKTLVNDLDLEVIAPDGKHYYGNSGIYSSADSCVRDGKWDRCNNVEGVLIPEALNGTYTLVVHAPNVPYGPQPFALVASADYLTEGSNPFNLPHQVFLPLAMDR
jgi:subtilisin family serine protease